MICFIAVNVQLLIGYAGISFVDSFVSDIEFDE